MQLYLISKLTPVVGTVRTLNRRVTASSRRHIETSSRTQKFGGHPRNLKNLMHQPWNGEDGAKNRDRLEKRLQQLVCSKQLGLQDAQAAIYADWQSAYRRYGDER